VSMATTQANLERMLVSARDAGVPAEHAAQFARMGYVPLRPMLAFHAACAECDNAGGPDEVLLAGTRGPGKSHAALAQVAADCLRVPGLKWLYLRKVQKAAGESLEDLVFKVLRNVKHEFSRSAGRVVYPNGSRILIGGYNDPADIEKYIGVEYDGIVIEECTQLPEDRIDKIRGSLRSTKPGWRERLYMTTNADGPGVGWCKSRFVIPFRKHKLDELGRRYCEAYYQDNPYLKDSYIKYLGRLTGALQRAWAKLDWDAFEGMAFPAWSYDRHVVQPFELPATWLKWRALDWGSAAPFVCLWLAKDPDTQRIYVYREEYTAGLTDTQQAQRILDDTPPGEVIRHTFADPASYWEKKSADDTWYTTADVYARMGVPLTKADNARIAGKRRLEEALSNKPDGKPGLIVFSTCPNVIEQVSTLVMDKVHIEDIDDSVPDHAYDALRYGLTNYNPAPAKPADSGKMQRLRQDYQGLREVFG